MDCLLMDFGFDICRWQDASKYACHYLFDATFMYIKRADCAVLLCGVRVHLFFWYWLVPWDMCNSRCSDRASIVVPDYNSRFAHRWLLS